MSKELKKENIKKCDKDEKNITKFILVTFKYFI